MMHSKETPLKIHKTPASAPLRGVAGTALPAALERLWNGKWYFPALFFLAAGLAAAGGMAGPLVFAGLICLFLVFCSDLLAAVFPFLLLCLLTVDHFDNYRAFLPYWWVLPLVAAAFVYHLSVYAKPFRAGRNFRPLALVTAATMLGGLGNLTMKDFLSPVSLYYTLGLGLGMLAVYMIAKTQLTADRSYDVLERFGTILYGAGLFAGFMVLRFYCMNLREFLQTLSTEFFSYRNYMATVMLMALPVPFYQSLRRCRHLAGAAVLYLCLLLTGSRSGMLFGTLLMAAGTVYLLH